MLCRLGVMAEHCKADDVLHGKSGELVIVGGRRDGDGPGESSGSTPSPMVLDHHQEAESSVVADPSAEQDDGLSSMLGSLSMRAGLSKYSHEKTRSFANLQDISPKDDIEVLFRKNSTYSTRIKASRGQASAGPGVSRSCHILGPSSKIIGKKGIPRGSSNRLKSKAYEGEGKKEYMG